MESRVSKYEINHSQTAKRTRINKNKEIYDEIEENNDLSYIAKIPAFKMNELKEKRVNREDFQKNYNYIKEESVESNNLSSLFKEEVKNYDINQVLEEAKKNKKDDNKPRRLYNTDYNFSNNLELKTEEVKEENSQLEELINTITRKCLTNEKDLLADLMATRIEDRVEVKEKPTFKEEDKIEATSKIDKSFYTKSMDLSELDFDIPSSKSKNKIFINIILVLCITIIMMVVIYFSLFKI